MTNNIERLRLVAERLRRGDLASLARGLMPRRRKPDLSWAGTTARVTPGFLGQVCDRPLIDLGEVGDGRYAGIHTPGYADGYAETYIHDQFVAGAEAYQRFYTNYEFFENLIRRGLELGGWSSRAPKAILDIGSGAGNSVIPLRRMFPGVPLVASDLSLELLRLLNLALHDRGMADAVSVMQLNAEELIFRDRSFDLVVGAAILHHLFHPERTLECCARILRPGGVALFFEPMQGANWMVRTFYAAVLADPRAGELSPNLRRYLRNRIRFFDDRVCTDKDQPQFLEMDDKWMFTREYFLEIATRSGFSACHIQPIGDPARQVSGKFQVHMKGFGQAMNDLPVWVQQLLDQVEAAIPAALRSHVLGDAILVLVK